MTDDQPLATSREIAAEGYWFGPRHGVMGRGWRPVAWQGWTVVVLTLAAALAVPFAGLGPGYVLVVVALAVALCWWKGTAPGPSKRATRQLQEIAARRRGTSPG